MLKVERIVLKGFTGMGLHEIETFDFTIHSPTTIILGGNGCGKTSLLSVFLPIAPSKSEFRDGGSYTNICLVNDHRYKFKVARKGNSLVCDIENLTTGTKIVEQGNAKVYNSRVEEITGITKEIKELLNGEVLLTDAGTELRRKWFYRLSTSDLTYALGFYQRLRKNLTMLNGGIEITSRKIAELRTRVIDNEEERQQLATRLKALEADLRELNKQIEQLPGLNRDVTVATIQSLLLKIEAPINAILEHRGGLPTEEQVEEARRVEATAREAVVSAETELSMLNKDLSLLMDESTRQDYLMRNHEGLKNTVAKLRELLKQWDTEHLFPELFAETVNIDQLKAATDARVWGQRLGTTLDAIKSTERLNILEEKLLTLDQNSAGLRDRLQRVENVLQNLNHERNHYLETAEVDCPQCQFKFRPGVRRSLPELEEAIRGQMEQRNTLQTQLDSVLRDRTELESDVNYMRQVREIVLTYSKDPVLSLFFKRLQERNVFTDNRSQFGSLCAEFDRELYSAIEYHETKHRFVKAEKEWENAVAAVGNVDGALQQKIAFQQERLGKATETLSERRREHAVANDTFCYLNELKATVDNFNAVFERLENDVKVTLTNTVVETLLNARENKLDAFTTARERYRQMENELNQLTALEKELSDLQAQQFNNKLMIQAFSPEKGVLRKYFYNAIVRITELMTRYIEQVWTYPMRVMPCDLTDGDLDYTFPVQLKTHPEPVPDVRKGSKAQRAIFNLMFRLTAYKALKLHQYPLLLDEPSEGMDEEHRNNLVGFIKTLANSGEFSQLLVVSHEAEIHSKLNEAAYCVIEPEGVTLPAVYNEGVKIVYAN